MVSHGERETLPQQAGSVPAEGFSADERTEQRLSWALGDRLTSQEDVERIATLRDPPSGATVTVFDLAAETYLVRRRTPVGRERYYEVERTTFAHELGRRSRYGRWHFVEE